MFWFAFCSFFYIINKSYSSNVISIYGDVYRDKEFFTKIFPWIIDNIGGEINVDYYLLGSGRYAIPQMCALSQLNQNTFLQSQYLQCEAEGNQSEKCLCESGISPELFRRCVQAKGQWASFAAHKYTQLRLDASPVVEIGPKNTVFGVSAEWYLKKICTIFGDNLPRGCVKPFGCCNSTTEAFTGKGVAHFECYCNKFCTVTPSENESYETSTLEYTTGKYDEDYVSTNLLMN